MILQGDAESAVNTLRLCAEINRRKMFLSSLLLPFSSFSFGVFFSFFPMARIFSLLPLLPSLKEAETRRWEIFTIIFPLDVAGDLDTSFINDFWNKMRWSHCQHHQSFLTTRNNLGMKRLTAGDNQPWIAYEREEISIKNQYNPRSQCCHVLHCRISRLDSKFTTLLSCHLVLF